MRRDATPRFVLKIGRVETAAQLSHPEARRTVCNDMLTLSVYFPKPPFMWYRRILGTTKTVNPVWGGRSEVRFGACEQLGLNAD